MSALSLDEIIALVGKLDDTPGEDTGRERFRAYLKENVTHPGELRHLISQSRGRASEQKTRAFRDLIIHLGQLLGFEVVYSPYEWLPGQIGYDGHWTSSWGLNVVIEIKTRETFVNRHPSLVRCVEDLIAQGKIPNWNLALGLYIIGHPDFQVNHLEKVILDEVQAHPIRITSLDSLFTLADMLSRKVLSHQDILTLLRSSSPSADWLVELVSRLATKNGQPDEDWVAPELDLSRFAEGIGSLFESLGETLIKPFSDMFVEEIREDDDC